MGKKRNSPRQDERRFSLMQGREQRSSQLLVNLMRDTGTPALIYLAERYGLRRVPGLSKAGQIERILRRLSASDLKKLEGELIGARYGGLSISDLMEIILRQKARPGKPRLDTVSAEQASLVEANNLRWVYTMRGHDASIDLLRRRLTCDCRYFKFAARQKALCKHLVTAFELLPGLYAREALIDLLLAREYGAKPGWDFKSPSRAA